MRQKPIPRVLLMSLFVLVSVGVFAQAPPERDAGPRVIVVRQLNGLGLAGYEYSARGYEDAMIATTDSEIPAGFYGSSIQIGIGTMVREELLVAFAPAVWYWPSFQAFAYSPGALLGTYVLGDDPVAPVLMGHGGIYIEFPNNFFGLFGEVSFGVEFRRNLAAPLQLTVGYLFTRSAFYGEVPVDPSDEAAMQDVEENGPTFTEDEVTRHSVTIAVSRSFGGSN